MPLKTKSPSNRRRARLSAADDANAGRTAADRLCHTWPDVSWVVDPPGEAWARASIERLAELMREQPAIFRKSREGSEFGAETLSSQPFRGLLECVQNADDLGATEVRVAIRQRGKKRELLIVLQLDRQER